MSSLDKEKTAPETSKKPSGTENIKNIAKQDILDLSNDEHLQKMKERYGEDENSFIKWIRWSEDYGKKCQKMTDKEVLDFAKTDPGLKQYHAKVIEKKIENKKPESKEKDEKKEEKKEITENKSEKKVEEKTKEQEIKTEKKGEEKIKEQETKSEKKPETPKENTPPVEKPESKPEEKKPEDKKPEVKKEKKKHFRSGRFKKKEKTEKKSEDKKEKKAGFISRVGSWIGKGIKAIPHQTWNLVSYAPRVARSSLKYVGFDWINHGLNKAGLKKNRDNYTSKWKWEQTAKKK